MKTGVAGAKATLARRARRAAWLAPLVLLAMPGLSLAHPERPSYWPNPRPDRSVSPPAGGEVPQARSLVSAVTGKGPGDVNVVCKGDQGKRSLVLLGESLRHAQREGFRPRPSQPKTFYSDDRASDLLRTNRALAEQCRYQSVQRAVNASGNNDRVVIMPGRYTESASRQAPSDDPRCAPDLYQTQANGDTAPSFEYQATCPNDQNLIYVQGREIAGPPPDPPLDNRQGIPTSELGACKLCNFQIEGSGPRPEDVILDAGKGYVDPDRPGAKPGGSAGCDNPDDCYTKHVVLRADRADGFVAKNLLTRGGREFGIYTEEIDGYLLARTKFFWNADYGQLSFTSDHGLMRDCDGFGSGDAVVYPGAAPETGSQADLSFYPDAPRYNTTVKWCDLRGSALGYSGSMGNAVRITQNHIYGNVTGIASDTLSSAGHPGFPTDYSQIDRNRIYSNNLDLYVDNPPVEPLVPVPLGTGIIYPGMNDALVHHNYIFDNWRFGSMLFAVPDALTSAGGAEGNVNPGISCPGAPENEISTSCGNEFYDNVMGKAPPGFTFPAALDQFGADHSSGPGPYPNGLDFWWDEFLGNTANCWFANVGPDGTATSVTGPGTGTPPDVLPDCATGTSAGNGDAAKEAYLLECSEGPDNDTGPTDCDWWRPAPQPTSASAASEDAERKRAFRNYAQTEQAHDLLDRMKAFAGFEGRP
jgi:hypothetical protein